MGAFFMEEKDKKTMTPINSIVCESRAHRAYVDFMLASFKEEDDWHEINAIASLIDDELHFDPVVYISRWEVV